MNRPFAHCPDCGTQLPGGDFPKKCAECGARHFLNPAPVVVLLQPVDGGLLAVRRAIEPSRGQLAFPGGFIDLNESWQSAAARELKEETGVAIDPEDVELFDVVSAPDGTVLVFGVAPEVGRGAIAEFEPTKEVSELTIVDEFRELAFPIHTEVLKRWLAS